MKRAMPHNWFRFQIRVVSMFYTLKGWWYRMYRVWLDPHPYSAVSAFILVLVSFSIMAEFDAVYGGIVLAAGLLGLMTCFMSNWMYILSTTLSGSMWFVIGAISWLDLQTPYMANVSLAMALVTTWAWYRWCKMYFQRENQHARPITEH